MKVRASLRSLRCKPGAKVVRRRNRIMVLNRKNPRWSGRQG
ncbi:50S ribosomal protein L36 [Asanoa sp. WMMD1127]|nr:50S ribosomal protein L36 [Asanoa sp. WMMD1127]MDG4823972.1 50S ribosomal protein L36 [Asanoa sp. WMMD1127]